MHVYSRDYQTAWPVEVQSTVTGNVRRVELRSCSPTRRQHFGTMTLAPRAASLRVLTMENHQRPGVRRVGTCLLEVADGIRKELGLQDVSLICQDEGAAAFFYRNGFRFVGEGAAEKNAVLARHHGRPGGSLPGEVILLGDMAKGLQEAQAVPTSAAPAISAGPPR